MNMEKLNNYVEQQSKYEYRIYATYESTGEQEYHIPQPQMILIARKDTISEVKSFVKQYIKDIKNSESNKYPGFLPKRLTVEYQLVKPQRTTGIIAEFII